MPVDNYSHERPHMPIRPSPTDYFWCLCHFWGWPDTSCRFPQAHAAGYCEGSQLEFARLGPPIMPPPIITVNDDLKHQAEFARELMGLIHDQKAQEWAAKALEVKVSYEDAHPIVIKSVPGPKKRGGWGYKK